MYAGKKKEMRSPKWGGVRPYGHGGGEEGGPANWKKGFFSSQAGCVGLVV